MNSKTIVITSMRLAKELCADEKCFLALQSVVKNKNKPDRKAWIFSDSDYLQLVLQISKDKYNIKQIKRLQVTTFAKNL